MNVLKFLVVYNYTVHVMYIVDLTFVLYTLPSMCEVFCALTEIIIGNYIHGI